MNLITQPQARWRARVVRGLACACFALSLADPSAAGPKPAAKLVNAALPAYGARVTVETGPGVVRDKQTNPQAYLDGNPHTRYVITGVPYTITVELPFKVPVDKLSLAQSDYAKEAAPKDLEITFDDGPVVRQTLELKRPAKRAAAWQDVPVGREVTTVKVKVLSNYDGAVKWGGLGDIAIWTAMNLEEKFRPPGYDAAAPAFVHAAAPVALGDKVQVTLPPLAAPGEHPRLLFTPRELAEFRATLPKTELGKATLAGFMDIANGALKGTPQFPTPEETAANKAGDAHGRLSKHAGALGLAYALTGDAKYARAARAVLVGYGQRYATYPRHSGRNRADSAKVTFQRLSEAMWLIPLVQSYDYIYGSGVLSDEDRKAVESGLIRAAVLEIRRKDPAEEVAARDKKSPGWRTETAEPPRQGRYPNWVNFYSSATMMAGAVLNDRDMMDLAAADFRAAVATGIGADGMWGEGAINYQLFAMGAISPGFETAARQGIDLWGAAGGRFKMLFDSPLRYAYPDGTLPGINDSARGRLGSWQTQVYDYGYLRYGDPRYAFLVNSSPRQLHQSDAIYEPTRVYEKLPEPPSLKGGSTLFGSLGFAILRDANKYALLKYGPHGGVHGHYDKLNLLLYFIGDNGRGDEMGGEPVFHFYDSPLHPEWTTRTVAHNTMTVDERSQTATEGKLLVFEDTPAVKVTRAESAGSYAGVLLDRTVVVTPDAVVDLFTGRSSLEHTWDRTLRFGGKLEQLPPASADAQPLGKGDGFQHIRVVRRQAAADSWQGTWDTKAGKFQVVLAGAPGQQLLLGRGPDNDEMAVARQAGRGAAFAAVYALGSWGNGVRTARWLAAEDAAEKGVSAFEVAQADGALSRVVVAHSPGKWQAAGWRSDARVLYAREKGEKTQLLIAGGTFAQRGPVEFHKDAAGCYLAQMRGGKLEAVSDWTPGPGNVPEPAESKSTKKRARP